MRISLVLFSFILGISVTAADWPGWRGADRMDVQTESGLLESWPDGGPKRLWLSENAGMGYSGPAIVNDVLFTMGARDQTAYIIAKDANTGAEKWATPVGKVLTNTWGDGPRATPTVDGDKVYAMGGQGDLVCANAADGKEIWKVSMVALGGKVASWGYTESVLVDGDQVICTPGGDKGTMAALNKDTGEVIWRSTEFTRAAAYSSPIVFEHEGIRQYAQLTQQELAGVAAKDGKKLWSAGWRGKTAVIPTPIYRDGHIFVTSGYGVGNMRFKLEGGSAKPAYSRSMGKIMKNHHGGVILYKDHLYGYSDGRGWVCMDWETGKPLWNDKSLNKGALAIADGKMYCVQESDGTVVLADASPDGWKELSRFTLDPQSAERAEAGRVWVHPVIVNGKMYLRDQQYLSCYSVKE
jgi:outer membrane protein assembly factor BamB